jgi:hypothetical protein
MAEYKGKWDEVENELFDIAAEITALGVATEGGDDTGAIPQL